MALACPLQCMLWQWHALYYAHFSSGIRVMALAGALLSVLVRCCSGNGTVKYTVMHAVAVVRALACALPCTLRRRHMHCHTRYGIGMCTAMQAVAPTCALLCTLWHRYMPCRALYGAGKCTAMHAVVPACALPHLLWHRHVHCHTCCGAGVHYRANCGAGMCTVAPACALAHRWRHECNHGRCMPCVSSDWRAHYCACHYPGRGTALRVVASTGPLLCVPLH